MFPFDKREKDPIKRPSLFPEPEDIFQGFEKDIKKLVEGGKGKTYVWGYTSFTGPDGKTQERQYSNLPGYQDQPQQLDSGKEDKPYHDVLDEGETLKVIVDLPGLEKDQIRVTANGDKIRVKAESAERKYDTEIGVPANVQDKPEKAEYRNGVLEITYKKSQRQDIKVQ